MIDENPWEKEDKTVRETIRNVCDWLDAIKLMTIETGTTAWYDMQMSELTYVLENTRPREVVETLKKWETFEVTRRQIWDLPEGED